MRKFAAVVVTMCALVGAAAAHDTWLLARSRSVAPGTLVTLDLTSGMAFPSLDHAIALERVATARFRLGGTVSEIPARSSGAGSLELGARLAQVGVATFWVELHPRITNLEPEQVPEYLTEIGAPEAIRRNWDARPGPKRWRHSYTKHAKAFVRVGAPAGDRSWSEPVGMAFEIVPESDPTALRAGDALVVRLLKDGRPLGGVKLSPILEEGVHAAAVETNADGRATIRLDRPGLWLLRAADITPVAKGDADWAIRFTTISVEVAPK